MKFISHRNPGGYRYNERYTVELSGYEAERIIPEDALKAIKEGKAAMGQEIKLDPVFEEHELQRKKARCLQSLLNALSEARDLFEPKQEGGEG